METPKNFIFYSDVAERLSKVTDAEARNDFAWRVIEYGAFGMKDWTDDEFKNGWLEGLFASIDKAQAKYNAKVESGKEHGREQKYDREELKKLISEEKKATEIAEILGVNVSAIYHDEIWINRKAKNYYIEF